jgi:NAD(P)H-dependent nitrite reductase small subunit
MTLLDHVGSVRDGGADGGSDEPRPWVPVIEVDRLEPDRGVCALVDGRPVAVFRCAPDDVLFAVDDVDPYSGASVLSRGIVGSIGDDIVVASPMHKQRFDLRTGRALDDPDVVIDTFSVRVERGWVVVSPEPVR